MVHNVNRGTLLPDPRYDAIRCVVLVAAEDAEDMSSNSCTARALLFDPKGGRPMDGLPTVQACIFPSPFPCCSRTYTEHSRVEMMASLPQPPWQLACCIGWSMQLAFQVACYLGLCSLAVLERCARARGKEMRIVIGWADGGARERGGVAGCAGGGGARAGPGHSAGL